ncbi:hypothetical protein ACXET9_07405 [Brachybacterium sp. DNPG3]
MASTYVRIQDRQYGTDSLFIEGRRSFVPTSMDDERSRLGVSVCADLESLLDYYYEHQLPIGDDPVIITLEGEPSGDLPLDAAAGEHLIIPTRVVSIESAEDAGFYDGIDERFARDGITF